MGMEARGIVAVALQRSDHAVGAAAVPGDFLEKLFDCGIEALAQEAEELAIVLEAEPEHFGDRHDVLTDGEIAQDILVDMLGKQQGALLMA